MSDLEKKKIRAKEAAEIIYRLNEDDINMLSFAAKILLAKQEIDKNKAS